MSRIKYQDHFVDGNGRVIRNGTVTVFLAGTTTLATVYSTEVTGTPIAGSAITTSINGGFHFWVDSGSYTSSQKFDLVLTKSKYVSMTYYDISMPWATASPVTVGAEIPGYIGDRKPASWERVFSYVAGSAFTLPASLVGSQATLEAFPTAQSSYDIQQNGVSIGSINFAMASSTATFTFPVDVTFGAGDKLTIVAPEQDMTSSGLCFTFRIL